jgi:hypothetical protein
MPFLNTGKSTETLMSKYEKSIIAARTIVSAQHAAQRLNDVVFSQPEFRGWPNTTMVPACLVAASGYAHAVELSKNDFLLMATAAYDLIRSEEKS